MGDSIQQSFERVLGATVREEANAAGNPSAGDANEETLISAAERVLMSTLSTESSSLAFLLATYDRCATEFRSVEVESEWEKELVQLNTLIVSYCGFTLVGLLFPEQETQRGVLQLYDALVEDRVSGTFFVDFASRFEQEEILQQVVVPVIKELGKSVMDVSPLGDFQKPVAALAHMLSVKAIALACVRSEDWLPLSKLTTGRSIEYESLLGPFFKVSTLPDIFGGGKPPIRPLLKIPDRMDKKAQQEVAMAVKTLRGSINNLQTSLQQVVLGLLRMGGEVREGVLEWVAQAIRTNTKGRAKMRIDLLKCATHGSFVNLSSVMLHLCLPFMDETKGYSKAWEKIDFNYLFKGGRISDTFKEDTRCAASLEELNQWLAKNNMAAEKEGGGGGADPYHFICNCFFMTSKVLHLGFMKSVRDFLDNMKELSRHQHSLRQLESTRHIWSNGPYRGQTEQQLNQLNAWINEHKEVHLCYECAIQEEGLLHLALQYYKLMGSWLLKFVLPEGDGQNQQEENGGGASSAKFVLPDEFRMLPEYFIDDVTELLHFTARIAERQPRVLQDEELEPFMSILVVFMGCPDHIHNPYLRAKMVDVLHHWVPPPDVTHPLVTKMSNMFEYHPLGNKLLVSHLLALYVDIEFTGSSNQFYDKFNIRHHIGEMLEYLWGIPVHKENWKRLANEQAGAFYLKFVNMLVNDAIYLLDEGMKKLPEVRQTLEAMDNADLWNSQGPQEQQEREAALRQNEGLLRQDLLLANVHIDLMEYTTVEITKAFLLPEMVERIATMLNYFLRFLVGPERKQLKVRNPEKYGWDPRKMLSKIIKIYMHLAAADAHGNFATAVTRDGRSYSNDLFSEAQNIVDRFGLLSAVEMKCLETFIEKLHTQVAADAKEDEMLGEIPDEFLDPILSTLMEDPVTLPSSKVVLDRSTIQRHLLSDQTDPFNRSKLTADMLVENTELRQKIEQWTRDQRTKKHKS
jgi:ubiquitin conjugation factor E4 B